MAKPTVSIAASRLAEAQVNSDIANNLVLDIAAAGAPFKGCIAVPVTAYGGGTAAAGTALTGTIAVTGAALGDMVLLSYDKTLNLTALTGFVDSAGSVTWIINLCTTGSGVVAAGNIQGLVLKKAQISAAPALPLVVP